MAPTSSMIKRCDICGDPGVVEAIIICSECKGAREHLYCMREFRTEPPEWWRCEECQNISPKTSDDEQKTKQVSTLLQQAASPKTTDDEQKTKKVSTLLQQTTSPKTTDDEQKIKKVSTLLQQTSLGIEGQKKLRNASQFNFKEKWVDKGRTKYLSCDEAVKLSSGSMKLDNARTEFRSARGTSKCVTPPRVFQQSTGLKEKATISTCQRTPIKSPQSFIPKDKARLNSPKEERNVKPNLQQPIVQKSFSPKATVSTCERTPIKSPQEERSFEPNLQQPAGQRSLSPKEKATVPTCERAHIKSPKEERNAKPTLQKSVVQQSFSPKEKATSSGYERTHVKTPEERNFKPNMQQPVVQQTFSPTEKATPPGCERTHIKSPEKEKNYKPNLQHPVVQPSFSQREKVVLTFRDRGNGSRPVKSSISSRRVEGTSSESETEITKNELLPPQKETDNHEKIETISGCRHDADVEAGKPNLTSGLPFSERDDPYIPSLNSYWKGCFYLPKGSQKLNESFKAHLPSRVHYKVYETVKKMPESINFELFSNHDIRTEIFPADIADIGLYFFPMFQRRSENDISVIDFMWRNNLVMRSNVEGLELFVLSSRVLPVHAQEFEGNYFLWGVFRKPKTAKKMADTSPLMVVKHEPRYDVPPGFKRICEPRYDVPPGFKRLCKP